jgi:type I restriction enzyme R subunit
MKHFTEASLEQTFTELLGKEGFSHHLGITITRKPEDVLIEEDLQNFLLAQYASQGITVNEIKSIILNLKSLSASDLYESNKTFLQLLSDGFILKREDRNQKDIYIQLIDYTGLNKHRVPKEDEVITIAADPETLYAKDNNIYKFVNQLEILVQKNVSLMALFISMVCLWWCLNLNLPFVKKPLFMMLQTINGSLPKRHSRTV